MVKRMLITLALVAVFVSVSEAQKKKGGNVRTINANSIKNGITVGVNFINTEQKFISSIGESVRVAAGSSSAAHFRFFQTKPTAMKLGDLAMKVIGASRKIKEDLQLTPQEATDSLPLQLVSGTELASTCLPKPSCTSSKYRTIDGSCNNLKEPLWGRSLTPMQRILPAAYADGIFDPRVGFDGNALPSARFVSSNLVPDLDKPSSDLSLMTMTFAQFVDHDFNLTPVFTTPNGSGIECCTDSGLPKAAAQRHPRCLPIEIPADDPFFGPLRRRCMNFVRSVPGPRPDCTLGYAEQLEELTHWADGSQIYGSDDAESRRLRSFSQGKMATSTASGPNSLPVDTQAQCRGPCFMAGDGRVTENQLLTEMHTIWMREHNRVAAELGRLNPSWNDEVLFQESRRIVIAELQHIVYNEFAPIVLGPAFIQTYKLSTSDSLSNIYDPNINPSMNNEFAAAAFRMGHSLLQGAVRILDELRRVDTTSMLSSIIQNSEPYSRPSFLDRVTLSLLGQPLQNFDKSITSEVTNRLFRGEQPFGMDLVALNVQRGRDHGLPGYNEYREICGLSKAASFDDLKPVISAQAIALFKRIYRHVDDIDLFIGGIYEDPIPGALVGRTFNCIIGDQFARLKKGDRFFYDLGGQPHSFRPDQLVEIRKTSLSRIICDNQNGAIKTIQPAAFRTVSARNSELPCNDPGIKRVDLSRWAGERTF